MQKQPSATQSLALELHDRSCHCQITPLLEYSILQESRHLLSYLMAMASTFSARSRYSYAASTWMRPLRRQARDRRMGEGLQGMALILLIDT